MAPRQPGGLAERASSRDAALDRSPRRAWRLSAAAMLRLAEAAGQSAATHKAAPSVIHACAEKERSKAVARTLC